MYHQRLKIPVWIFEGIFYDMCPRHISWVRGDIVAVSSYEGEAPSFVVVVGGMMFHCVPPHMVSLAKQIPEGTLPGDLLSDKNCPHGPFHEAPLMERGTAVTFRHKGLTRPAKYLTTLDWGEANENMHILQTPEGDLAFKANPSVCFLPLPPGRWPDWKKLRHSFKV